MIKLMLNLQKFNNYAFFCPVSRLHLTVSSPVGFSNEVTPAILKALKAKTILDVDGVVNIETGTVKVENQVVSAKAPIPKVEPVVEPKAEQPVAEPVQEKAPEPKSAESDEKADDKPKKGNKKTTKADAE